MNTDGLATKARFRPQYETYRGDGVRLTEVG